MTSLETKTASSWPHQVEKKNKPFFKKEGQDSFFSEDHDTPPGYVYDAVPASTP